jgi:hypothetical protein
LNDKLKSRTDKCLGERMERNRSAFSLMTTQLSSAL